MKSQYGCVHALRGLTMAVAVTVVLGAGPAWAAVDLIDGGSAYRWVSPTNVYAGQSVIVQGRAYNQGSTASAGFYVGIYLSTDTTITTGDRYIGRSWVGGLNGSSGYSFTETVTVGAAVPPGTYYVGYIQDYDGAIAESAENNNASALTTRRLIVLNWVPNTPTCQTPANGATGQSLTPTLTSSTFVDGNGDGHAASQWLVDNNSDWSSPAYDSGESLTAKTSVTIPSGRLSANTMYYWSVRYKDSRGGWSAWASAFWFRTGSSGGGGTANQVFDATQPITGTSASRWAFMTAWNLSSGALLMSPTWYNGNSTWNHDASGTQQWIARFVYDQSAGQTRALAWYYRQDHVQ